MRIHTQPPLGGTLGQEGVEEEEEEKEEETQGWGSVQLRAYFLGVKLMQGP